MLSIYSLSASEVWESSLSFSVVLPNYAEKNNNKPTFITYSVPGTMLKHLYSLTYLKFKAMMR